MSHAPRDDDRHPPQERDRLRGRSALLLILFGLAVTGGGIAWAWDLLGRELARERPGLALPRGPEEEAAGAAPRRVGGVLQGPIAGGWAERPPVPAPAPPQDDLESWSWADPGHRYARIPIEKAMELLVRRQQAEGPATGEAAP